MFTALMPSIMVRPRGGRIFLANHGYNHASPSGVKKRFADLNFRS
jgi:hypothetical protein